MKNRASTHLLSQTESDSARDIQTELWSSVSEAFFHLDKLTTSRQWHKSKSWCLHCFTCHRDLPPLELFKIICNLQHICYKDTHCWDVMSIQWNFSKNRMCRVGKKIILKCLKSHKVNALLDTFFLQLKKFQGICAHLLLDRFPWCMKWRHSLTLVA